MKISYLENGTIMTLEIVEKEFPKYHDRLRYVPFAIRVWYPPMGIWVYKIFSISMN